VQASAANVPLTGFSPVEDAFDEIAATLLNLERQLCRAFLFSPGYFISTHAFGDEGDEETRPTHEKDEMTPKQAA
jgi:hypothetical protein